MNALFDHWSSSKNVTKDQWGFVHFIGHSLGAHTVGHAAKLLKIKDNFEINRITGFDPAEPCFETVDKPPLRLSRSSAKFVDVIHTAVANTKNSAFGLLEPLGNHILRITYA